MHAYTCMHVRIYICLCIIQCLKYPEMSNAHFSSDFQTVLELASIRMDSRVIDGS